MFLFMFILITLEICWFWVYINYIWMKVSPLSKTKTHLIQWIFQISVQLMRDEGIDILSTEFGNVVFPLLSRRWMSYK